MIVVFLLDTSASMNQRLDGCLSAFELAKSGVEHFLKTVNKRKHPRINYMLVTYEAQTVGGVNSTNPNNCVKINFKDDEHALLNTLKFLEAHDVSTPNYALSTLFHYLDVHRVHNGRDTPGQGIFLGLLESTVILWFTDGGRMVGELGILDKVSPPDLTKTNPRKLFRNRTYGGYTSIYEYYMCVFFYLHPFLAGHSKHPPGSEIYNLEPFRLDQRLYGIFLQPESAATNSQLKLMAEATGGQVWQASSAPQLQAHIEFMLGIPGNVCRGVQPRCSPVASWHGVTVRFQEKPTPETGHSSSFLKFIHVEGNSRQSRVFPLPEPYWPDGSLPGIIPRPCHPHLSYMPSFDLVTVPSGFPFDKYTVEVDPFRGKCPLTNALLGRPSSLPACWPVYVQGSHRGDPKGYGHACGFLRANTLGTAFALYVMPYNYKVLFGLLDKVRETTGWQTAPSPAWLIDFQDYLSDIPPYYIAPLRQALKRIHLGHLMSNKSWTMARGMQLHLEKIWNSASKEYTALFGEPLQSTRPSPRTMMMASNAFDIPKEDLGWSLVELRSAFSEQVVMTGKKNPGIQLKEDEHAKPIALMGETGERRVHVVDFRPLDEEVERRQFQEKESAFGSLYKHEKPRSSLHDETKFPWSPLAPDSPLLLPSSPGLSASPEGIQPYVLRARTLRRLRTAPSSVFHHALIPPLSPTLPPSSPIQAIPEQKYWIQPRPSFSPRITSPDPVNPAPLSPLLLPQAQAESDVEYPPAPLSDDEVVDLTTGIMGLGSPARRMEQGFEWGSEDGHESTTPSVTTLPMEDVVLSSSSAETPIDPSSLTGVHTVHGSGTEGNLELNTRRVLDLGRPADSPCVLASAPEANLTTSTPQETVPPKSSVELTLPFPELVCLLTDRIRADVGAYDESQLRDIFIALFTASGAAHSLMQRHELVCRCIRLAVGMQRYTFAGWLKDLTLVLDG